MVADETQKSCREFTELLGSAAPAPGGGGASAVAAALGTALGRMVASLTVGKPRYAAVEEEMQRLLRECHALEAELLDQVAADAEGFLPLARAYSLPKDAPGRDAVMAEATVKACEVPLHIMELGCRALDCLELLARDGSRLALSDAGCGAALVRAGLEAAALNVYINTKTLRDRGQAAELDGRCERLLTDGCARAAAVYETVRDSLRG